MHESSTKKIKICFLLPYFFFDKKGGAEYQAYLIAEQLAKKNYEIHYICTSNSDNIKKIKKYQNILIHAFPIRKILKRIFFGKDFVFDTLRILRRLKKIDPDIVYQRVGCAYTGIAAYYCKKYNKHFIWHISGDHLLSPYRIIYNKEIISNYIDYQFFIYGINNAQCVIAQTINQKKLLMNNFKRECDAVIPNFLPFPDFLLHKTNHPISIVWIANWKRMKKPEIFVTLAKKFQHYHNVRFIMIGRIAVKAKWQNEILSNAKSINNLEIKGELPIKDINQILSKSHILVNTSITEGFSNVFIQAWMHAMPVLSMHADPNNLLKNRELGYLCPNFSDLLNQLRLLIENDKERNYIGIHCRNYAINFFSIDKNISKIIQVINNLK